LEKLYLLSTARRFQAIKRKRTRGVLQKENSYHIAGDRVEVLHVPDEGRGMAWGRILLVPVLDLFKGSSRIFGGK